ncbi:MAG: PAS domain S-box protein [Deltaproteobacteria bacterium]|nr:PAS domain S-box protein [Deltaproteobacteria bacterium]
MERAVLDATICDYVDQGVIATNEHLKIIFVNRWIETFTGHCLEDVAGRSIEEVFPELKRNNKLSYYSVALQGNHVVISHHVNKNFFLFPSVVEHEGIDYMIQNVKIFPIIQESGIGGTLTIIQDVTQDFLRNCQLEKVITDLKKAQKHLTESQELYKILINTISDILVIVDSSGRIHFMERLSDFNVDDVIGTHWIDWVHPDDVVRVKRMFNALAEGNFGGQDGRESVRVEVRLKVAKERWHYFEAAGGNVRHAEDSENRIVISLRDVEKRKELERLVRK